MKCWTSYRPLLALIGIALLLTACGGKAQPTPEGIPLGPQEPFPLLQVEVIPYHAELYVAGINFPTRMAWAPDGRLFVTEKGGALRVVSPEGDLQPEPVIELPTDEEGEQGLLGIALDPDYETNHHIWLYHTWSDPDNERPGEVWHRLVRITENNGKGSDVQVAWEIKDGFTESTILNGGEIGFGPDGMLYVSPGSTNNILLVVDRDAPHGKIHRMTPTIPTGIPEDSLRPDSTIWAYGFRNVYGFTFHPLTGQMYATDNGPDCDDEIDLVVPGGDHGWRVDGLCEDNNLPDDYPERFIPPVLYYTPPISPTSIMFYTGDVFPEWKYDMFFCAYNFGKVYRVKLAEDGVSVLGARALDTGYARCAASITTGPDGFIYFSDLAAIYRMIRLEE
jgi:glucose/arabinose dehydrogenase